jgi:ABC-2 type transport system ATP-binding protein
MLALEIEDLSKTYSVGFWKKRPRHVLKPLNLSVEEGEVFGYLGPNGAGKTTTLKILMGLVYPTTGSARIFGHSIDRPEAKLNIGFSPEQPYFYDHLTAQELLEYYGQLSDVPARDRSRRAAATLERVGLKDVDRLQLRKFSKGMLQRVSLAQAILHDPKFLFLDEPMSGLDPIGRREVRDLIQELKDEGKTVFFSTHILSDAETLCDRVAVLNQGELRGIGVVRELLSQSEKNVEILWHGVAGRADLERLGATIKTLGEMSRAVLPHEELNPALDALRRNNARIESVNPVRHSLEEFFLQKLDAKLPPARVEVARP